MLVVGKEEDESLTDRSGGAKNTWWKSVSGFEVKSKLHVITLEGHWRTTTYRTSSLGMG